MINKSLITTILLLCAGCTFLFYRTNRENLDIPIHLSYSNKNITIDLHLNSRDIKYRYYYCGTMISELLSDQPTKELILVYSDKESGIYPDTIVDVVNFWDRGNWDSKGFRQEKICIGFKYIESVDWENIKFIEIDGGKTRSGDKILK